MLPFVTLMLTGPLPPRTCIELNVCLVPAATLKLAGFGETNSDTPATVKFTVKTAVPAITCPVYDPGARYCEAAEIAMFADCPGASVPLAGVAVSQFWSVVNVKFPG